MEAAALKAYVFSLEGRTRSVALSPTVCRLVQDCLMERAGAPVPFEIRYDPRGKPEVYSDPRIYISVSHTGDAGLLGISPVPCGVDMELVRPVDYKAISRRFFTPEEADYAAARGERAFFQLWTLKESCLKLLGTGLAGGLASVPLVVSGALLEQTGDIRLHTVWQGDHCLSFALRGDETVELACAVSER